MRQLLIVCAVLALAPLGCASPNSPQAPAQLTIESGWDEGTYRLQGATLDADEVFQSVQQSVQRHRGSVTSIRIVFRSKRTLPGEDDLIRKLEILADANSIRFQVRSPENSYQGETHINGGQLHIDGAR
jgi:hypothetical protein